MDKFVIRRSSSSVVSSSNSAHQTLLVHSNVSMITVPSDSVGDKPNRLILVSYPKDSNNRSFNSNWYEGGAW